MFQTKPQVIVLGAGFAGLSASTVLQGAGFGLTILEEASKPGGRVQTYNINDGLYFEFGGEWLASNHEYVLAYCKKYDLKLVPRLQAVNLLFENKCYLSDDTAIQNALAYIRLKASELPKAGSPEALYLDSISFKEFLSVKKLPVYAEAFICLLAETDYGESMEFISAYSVLANYYYKGDHLAAAELGIDGGNIKLAEALASNLSERCVYNSKVKYIYQEDDQVTVVCEGGEMYAADYLVCTAPINSVGIINWQPALPDSLINEYQKVAYGRVTKTAFIFKKPISEVEASAFITDTDLHHVYQPVSAGGRVLISYATGEHAEAVVNMKDEQLKQQLKKIYKNLDVESCSIMQKTWVGPTMHNGGYSLFRQGHDKNILEAFRKPHQLTYFAGEHTANFHGFMEGALESGERAAYDIIKHYDKATGKSNI